MSSLHRKFAAAILLLCVVVGMVCANDCAAQESGSRNELLNDLPTTVPDNVVREPKTAPIAGEKGAKVVPVPKGAPVPVRGSDAEPTADQRAAQLTSLLQKATAQLGAADLSLELKQVQQQILHQMDEWLAAEQGGTSQAGGKSAAEGGSSGDAAEGTSPTKNGVPSSENVAGQQPSQQPSGSDPAGGALSTEKGGSGTGTAAATRSVRELADSFWGNLPPQERQRLKDAMPERFLPQYQRQIEAYYRALALPQTP